MVRTKIIKFKVFVVAFLFGQLFDALKFDGNRSSFFFVISRIAFVEF